MLELMVDLAKPEEWDLDYVYKDIVNGTENGMTHKWLKPNPEFAKWFAKRFNIR